jgi:uncharacterized protein (TIGR00251 family)
VVRVCVRVTPRADRDEVCGWRGAELLVRVTAPPEAGKANAAVEKTVAAALGLPKSAVRVVRGHSSRSKQVEIEADDSLVTGLLGDPDPGLF